MSDHRARSHARASAYPSAPGFPGATLVVDGAGEIGGAWHGPTSPIEGTAGDLFVALGLADTSSDAARVQLLLASAIGAIAPAWGVLASDAPSVLARGDQAPLAVQWQPVTEGGVIVAVAVFVHVIAATAALEPDDPTERDRLCVDALGLLDECDGCLRHLRAHPDARHSVHRLFRAIHTIKGSTRGTRLRAVSALAHQIEEILDILRRSEDCTPTAVFDQVALDLRRLRAEVQAARPRNDGDDAMTELSAESRPLLADLNGALESVRSGDLGGLAAAVRAVDLLAAAAERARMRALALQTTAARNALQMIDGPHALELLAEAEAIEPQLELYRAVYREIAGSDAGPSMLATLGSWLDAPLDQMSGLDRLAVILADAGVPSFTAALSDGGPYGVRRALAVLTDARAMFELARPRDDGRLRLERAQRELLELLDALTGHAPYAMLADARRIAHRLVWTPLSSHGRSVGRMVKRVASELGKQVALDLDLGELVVAPEVSRLVGEILVHAVRNAADHGIESPGERAAAGKDTAGTICIRAREVGARLQLVVTDDGRGVDLERVRRTAVARGLVSAATAGALPDADVVELLFTPGFSTVTTVTAISGRGVGMDVIRCLAEEHGGSATLASRTGVGTELTLDLPFATP